MILVLQVKLITPKFFFNSAFVVKGQDLALSSKEKVQDSFPAIDNKEESASENKAESKELIVYESIDDFIKVITSSFPDQGKKETEIPGKFTSALENPQD